MGSGIEFWICKVESILRVVTNCDSAPPLGKGLGEGIESAVCGRARYNMRRKTPNGHKRKHARAADDKAAGGEERGACPLRAPTGGITTTS